MPAGPLSATPGLGLYRNVHVQRPPVDIPQCRDESDAFRNLLEAAYDVAHVPSGPERVAMTIQAAWSSRCSRCFTVRREAPRVGALAA